MTPLYTLCDDISFRIASPEIVEVLFHDRSARTSIPIALWQLLPEFRTPASALAVHSRYDINLSVEELSGLLDALVEKEVLRRHDQGVPADSLQHVLRRDVFEDEAQIDEIASHLRDGRMVVIPDALPQTLAERVHGALNEHVGWQPYEGHFPNFHYRHHNIYKVDRFPAALREAAAIFESGATRSFVERLSGESCSGSVTFGASWYQPGDYSLPHTDSALNRSVAFIWHLTKDWDSRWGGQLIWCPTGIAVQPRFNWLTLFRVTSNSLHFVAPISASAASKRLAVNGWWLRSAPASEGIERAPSAAPDVARLAEYGTRVIGLGASGTVRIV